MNRKQLVKSKRRRAASLRPFWRNNHLVDVAAWQAVCTGNPIMDLVKNQHYVPRFYLRHFCGSDDRLFAFDKPTGKKWNTTVESVANENYFYDHYELDKSSGKPQLLEHFFHPLEGDISTILNELTASLEDGTFTQLSAEHRAKLSIFLVYQFLRTKEKREELRQFIGEFARMIADIHLQQKGLSDSSYDIESDEALFQARFLLDRKNVEQLANILHRHIWIIIKNLTTRPFYTSDNPFVKKANIPHPVRSMNGIASPGIEIAFPIHPSYCLLLGERSFFAPLAAHDGFVMETHDEENITHYNSLQVIHSYRQVYCSKDDFVLVEAKIALSPDLATSDRIRVVAERGTAKPHKASFVSRILSQAKRWFSS